MKRCLGILAALHLAWHGALAIMLVRPAFAGQQVVILEHGLSTWEAIALGIAALAGMAALEEYIRRRRNR